MPPRRVVVVDEVEEKEEDAGLERRAGRSVAAKGSVEPVSFLQ